MHTEKSRTEKPENMWLNLGLNLIIPSALMMKGQEWFGLSPKIALIVALAFPVSYGLYDFATRKKTNVFSILGFVSILLTGGIGLLALPPQWVAIKEAAIPLVLGIILLLSSKTKKPLVRIFLYNDQILDTAKVDQQLENKGTRPQFNALLTRCTWLIGLSFFISAVLNYTLARIIVTADPGQQAELFTQQLGKMNAWSMPVIALPTSLITLYALWQLIQGLTRLTGLKFEDMLAPHLAEKQTAAANSK